MRGVISGLTRRLQDRYVELALDQLAARARGLAGWIDAPVPAPRGELQYSPLMAQLLDIDSPHVRALGGSARSVLDWRTYAAAAVSRGWPRDPSYNWRGPDEVARAVYKPARGMHAPAPLPFELTTPAGLCWLFSHSIGCLLLRAASDDSGDLEADARILHGLPCKRDADSLDVRVRFARGGHGLRLRWIEHAGRRHQDPRAPGFVRAARAVGTATLTIVTIQHHAVYTHLIGAEGFVITNTLCLSPTHPVRRLLASSEYGVLRIGELANLTLLKPYGGLHVAMNLTGAGVGQLVARARAGYRARRVHVLPGMLAARGLDIDDLEWCPALADAAAWWALLRDYVRDYLAVAYPDDRALAADAELGAWTHCLEDHVPGCARAGAGPRELITEACAAMIFAGTVYHEIVGAQVWELASSPYRLSGRLRRGDTPETMIASRLESMRAVMIAFGTTIRSPRLMRDWSYLAPPGPARGELAAVMGDFLPRMRALQRALARRNDARPIPYTLLDPANLECSVAV